MKSVDAFMMLRFYKNCHDTGESLAAIVTQFNGKIRVLDGNSKELFFNELTNAIKHLIDEGYFIEYLFNTSYKYPEQNRL